MNLLEYILDSTIICVKKSLEIIGIILFPDGDYSLDQSWVKTQQTFPLWVIIESKSLKVMPNRFGRKSLTSFNLQL